MKNLTTDEKYDVIIRQLISQEKRLNEIYRAVVPPPREDKPYSLEGK